MPNMTRRLLAVCFFIFSASLSAFIYDNRYFRILEVPYSRERYFYDPNCDIECGHKGESRYRNDFFVLVAHHGVDDHEDRGIPEIFGKVDLANINTALARLNPDHITPMAKLGDVLAKGRLEGEGITFVYDQQILDWLAAGVSFSFLHLTSDVKFPQPDNTEGRTTDKIIRSFNTELGFRSNAFKHTGFTDVDAYVRFGNVWNYVLKCRRIDLGFKVGGLFPAGQQRELYNLASVPFGGDGHFGFYVGLDGQFELKEDLKVGLISRLIKRFSKTSLQRLPIAHENQLFGALIAPARVEPGVTFAFAPYIRLDGIRDGLGVMANYTLIWHDNDEWEDKRPFPRLPMVNTGQLFARSHWAAEIVTLNFFYDFSKVEGCGRHWPLVSLYWDIPVSYIVAENVVQTNHIALGVEFTW